MMTLRINGEERRIPEIRTLSELLSALEIDPRSAGVAVALNRRVVARRELETTPVRDGDQIEVVHAVQGG
jgi:thiamine biosynthesis protein ThiS